MKYTNKFLGALCLAAFGFASCADDYSLLDYKVEKPATIEAYEYLNDYKPLKDYVNADANPDFKLGTGITASEYNAGGMVYRLVNSNYDEITAGNAMKYASVVGDNGSMSFDAVSSFVSQAKAGGKTIYGHTLAWHAQQNTKYLNSLLKDKELPFDPDAVVEVDDFYFDFEDGKAIGGWGLQSSLSVAAEGPDGSMCLVIDNPVAGNSWEAQSAVDQNFLVGANHIATFKIKATGEGVLGVGFQDPVNNYAGAGNFPEVNFTTEWQEVRLECVAQKGATRFLFSYGQFAGKIFIDDLKLVHEEAKPQEVEVEATSITYQDGPYPFYAMGCEPPVINGAIHFEPTGAWSQFFIFPGAQNTLDEGNYVAYLDMTSSEAVDAGIQLTIQNGWGEGAQNITANLSVEAGQKVYRIEFKNVAGGAYDVILKPQTAMATLDVKSIAFKKVMNLNSLPLTAAEKKDTITWAMNNWISGMMAATEGYVSTWDVVNEPISGTDVDGDGFYDLWSSKNSAGDGNFYYTDYLGDLDYVRTAVKQAREHYTGEAPLKLFINDFNLESDWDDNKKVKSLINWIAKWEEDGETVIDGIGTQMHVSYYENAATQASKEAAIENMFELLAATGKLIKISELDMGYVDANGTTVKTANMTEDQHMAMAEFYKFIIKKYFEIIPANQQYGITHWSPTDSPSGSGWRAEEPIGLWDANYNRKHVYAGFADGLAGAE